MHVPTRFVGLHAHSGFSVGDAIGLPQEHIDAAIASGMDGLALTDHGNMNGMSHQQIKLSALKKAGVKFQAIPGIEAYFVDSLSEWKVLYAHAKASGDLSPKLARLRKAQQRAAQTVGNELASTEADLDVASEEKKTESEDTEGGTVVENEEESKANTWQNPVFQRNHVVLLPKNGAGLNALYRMVSESHMQGFYRYPRMDFAMLREHCKGNVIALSACLAGVPSRVVTGALPLGNLKEMGPGTPHDFEKVQRELARYVQRFQEALGPENYFVEIQWNKLPIQHLVNLHVLECARRTGVSVVATADSHYSSQAHWRQREIYKAMAWAGKTKAKVLNPDVIPDSVAELKCELYPKNASQMWEAFLTTSQPYESHYKGFEEQVCKAIEITHDIAHHVIGEVAVDKTTKLPSLTQLMDVPKNKLEQLMEANAGSEDAVAFKELVRVGIDGLKWRKKADNEVYVQRLHKELSDIRYLQENYPQYKMAKYFLTYKKIMDITNKELFTGNGRGSVSGSLLAYVLNISQVDPLRFGTLWERFISRNKKGNPDIDNDWSDRDRAVEMLREHFGAENVIPVSNFAQLQLRSLIKDLAKFMNLSFDVVNESTVKIESEVLSEKKKEPGFDRGVWVLTYEEAMEYSPTFRKLMEDYPFINENIQVLFKQIRNVSRHAGGVIITADAKTAMPLILSGGELQTPWPEGVNYRHLEEFGLIKFDVLGLGTLRMFQECIAKILMKQGVKHPTFEQVKTWFWDNLHPDNNAFDDRKVYEHVFWNKNTAGIFQFVNDMTQDFMVKMKPTCINDIAIATSIFRPGPLSLGIDKKFLENRANPESVVYKHPILREVFGSTEGLLIFQEQLQLIYHKLGGVPLDETDAVRKAFTKKEIANKEKAARDRTELRSKFAALCFKANGVKERVCNELFDEMEKLVAYSFNKCLHHETTVETQERGEVMIKNVLPNEHVNSVNGFVPVIAVHANGAKKLFRIKTKNGRTVTCTLDHKLQTPHGMKTLKEILDQKLPLVCNSIELDYIVSAEAVGIDETYDLEVDHPDHTFYANGISVSNSHALAYAITTYQCAWFLTYHPDEWVTTYLDYCTTSKGRVTGKEDPKAVAIKEAKRLGYTLTKPDINTSDLGFAMHPTKPKTIVPGFASMKHVGAAALEEIKKYRPYRKIEDLILNPDGTWRHSKFNVRALETLIKLGALDSMGLIFDAPVDGPDTCKIESYQGVYNMVVVHGEDFKKLANSKRGRPKVFEELAECVSKYCWGCGSWTLAEQIGFQADLAGSVDFDMLVSPTARAKLDNLGFKSVDECTESGNFWGVVGSITRGTTKTGKPFLKLKLFAELAKEYLCFIWDCKGLENIEVNNVVVGQFQVNKFGLTVRPNKLYRVD